MKGILILVLAFILPLLNGMRHKYITLGKIEEEDMPKNVVVGYFNNRVDHFNLSSTKTYSQKYWYVDDFWEPQEGPAILYIQGEGPGEIIGTRTMPFELAQQLHARLFSLEHRFYGVSQPCKDWSLDCLSLLNHHQAMADIANFIETKTDEMDKPDRKWIIVGGSYAGALVGWFMSKYSHLVEVAYSSSGVINSILDFQLYMRQINIDLKKDPICYTAVTDLNAFATYIITQGEDEEKDKLKASMKASFLNDLDFLMYFTDIYVGEIQYSNRKTVCQNIIKMGGEKDMYKKAELYAKLGVSIGVSPEDYTYNKERETHIDFASSSRQWMYQTCSSLGYFQTGGVNNPLRPSLINLDYWQSVCRYIFGKNIFPSEQYTNGITGDVRIVQWVNKTIFVNGGDDPWQWAGVRDEKLTNDDLLVMIIKCDDCAHCIDLYKPNANDSKTLIEARKTIKEKIGNWMSK